MIKVTGSEGIEYIIDGERYWPEEALKEALGCKDDDIFGGIKKLREERDGLKANLELTNRIYKEHHDFVDKVCEAVDIRRPCTESGYDNAVKLIAGFKRERDELKEKCDKMKKRANAMYGVSCGYSGDKAPAFRCNVISYSWNFGLIAAHTLMDEPSYPISSDSIRVELDLTPTANYKGTFDLEDLKHYIQEYGREKKLGIVESVDYQNAKAARAELAYLYKTVLGKESLDRDLSPHEVMKAILDEYKRVRDSQFAFSQCLRSVYMEIHEGTGYDINDIYAAPDKLAECIITRYNSARMSSRLETLSEIDEHIDELCDKYNVVQPDRKSVTKERLDYIFGVLDEWRNLANDNFNKAEGFRKEKRTVEDSLAELRAKVREIYRSVFCDCRWEVGYSHCSALNDINEEYKRVKDFFKEKNDELKEAKQSCKDYTELCKVIWEGEKLLIEFRDDVAKAIGMDYPTTNQVILNNVQYIYKDREDAYKIVSKLNDQVTALSKAKEDLQQMLIASQKDAKGWTNRCISLADTHSEMQAFRRNAIEDLKSRGFCFRPEENETLPEIYDKLLKRYDWAYGVYKEQYRLRQMWHVRWESENERANGEHKRAEKLRKDVTALTNHIELLKLTNASQANSIVASQAFKNECRKLKEEKAKVIAALGQDIWDDCVK